MNTMRDSREFFRAFDHYRVWVDETGVGRVRIVKRINFTTLVRLFEELHAEIKKKNNPGRAHIVFYISKSLYGEMSVNAKEFLEFCQSCMGIQFELVLVT